ncbi:MAG TPA: hypothetical protein VKA48_05080 [Gammaproteobacteria bacterium]|nr:hypothetical protein [Gammaproteobacteria bacterium]
MEHERLTRIPEDILGLLEQLEEGRYGIDEDRGGQFGEGARSTSPPLLCGEIQLDEEQARELKRFFQRYRDTAVEKPHDRVRGPMIVAPRKYERLDNGFYVEFEALAFL